MTCSIRRLTYAAGEYRHRAKDLVQVRVVRRGSSYVNFDVGAGERRSFTRPGDMIVSLPGSPTYFHIFDSRQLTVIQIESAEARKILAVFEARLEDLRPLLDKPVRDTLTAELCRRLDEVPPKWVVYHEWTAGLILASLLRLAKSINKKRRGRTLTEQALRKTLRAMEHRLSERLRVQDLADEAKLSRRVFASAFSAAMGMPVHQYILRARTQLAVKLLKTTELPISEIALRAGFSHQAHLTRVVGRLTGKTPRDIRKATDAR